MPSSHKQPRNLVSNIACSADACETADHDLVACAPSAKRGDFIDQTIAIWQKRTERKLTREDGREIIENISGFFSILQEWDQRERAAERAKAALSQNGNVGGVHEETSVEPDRASPSPIIKGPNIRLNANSPCTSGRRCDSLVREFTLAWGGRNEKQ